VPRAAGSTVRSLGGHRLVWIVRDNRAVGMQRNSIARCMGQSPISGAKRTSGRTSEISPFDPKATWRATVSRGFAPRTSPRRACKPCAISSPLRRAGEALLVAYKRNDIENPKTCTLPRLLPGCFRT
jgi:hypothetical protein